MNVHERNLRLKKLLLRGDPAAGQDLDAESTTYMRRAILQELQPTSRYSRAGALLWSAASAAVILVALFLWQDRSVQPPGDDTVPQAAATAALNHQTLDRAQAEQPAREIHFVTERGTRVVWTLDPKFDL